DLNAIRDFRSAVPPYCQGHAGQYSRPGPERRRPACDGADSPAVLGKPDVWGVARAFRHGRLPFDSRSGNANLRGQSSEPMLRAQSDGRVHASAAQRLSGQPGDSICGTMPGAACDLLRAAFAMAATARHAAANRGLGRGSVELPDGVGDRLWTLARNL